VLCTLNQDIRILYSVSKLDRIIYESHYVNISINLNILFLSSQVEKTKQQRGIVKELAVASKWPSALGEGRGSFSATCGPSAGDKNPALPVIGLYSSRTVRLHCCK
jgi:hypothetical protein